MLAYKDGSRVRLISRQAVDHTSRFRELAAAIAKIRTGVVVLDGAVSVYDEKHVGSYPPTVRGPGRWSRTAATKAWWQRIHDPRTDRARRGPG